LSNSNNRYLKARKDWMKNNPPTFEGYYFCHYGYKALDYLVVDHKNGRDGDLLTDHDNFVASCSFHNMLKGSMKYDRFIQYLKDNPRYRQCH